jgi:5'-deoxynucleotidase YfbR-like HD superfamily hydrolase
MKTDSGFTTDDGDRSWICSYRGNKIHPLDLRDDEIDIEDIGVALSRLPRFLARTTLTYSVAEHCVRASLQVDPKDALVMLLHDCEEAYFGDIPRPVKHHPMYAEIRALAEATKRKILTHFGINPELPEWVHDVDNRMLATEKRDLLAQHGNAVWSTNVEPYPFVIRPWSQGKACKYFLGSFHDLTDYRFWTPKPSVVHPEGSPVATNQN